MISLDNAFSDQDIREFHQRFLDAAGLHPTENIIYHLEPKFDGLGLSLTYSEGRLIQALTR